MLHFDIKTSKAIFDLEFKKKLFLCLAVFSYYSDFNQRQDYINSY